ncbi:MAG: ribonuclease P protein component [Candidatus Bathyarchaeia archaeon]
METLRKSRDFKRVIEGGDRIILETISIFIRENHEGKTRVGISVSRKSGGSVKRNKIKRRIREALRKNAHGLPPGIDMVIMARRGAGDASFRDIEEDIRKLVDRSTKNEKKDNECCQ